MLNYNAIQARRLQKNVQNVTEAARKNHESLPDSAGIVVENQERESQDEKTSKMLLARTMVEKKRPFSLSSCSDDTSTSDENSQVTFWTFSPVSPSTGQEPEPKQAAEVPVALLVRTEEAVSWLAACLTKPQPIADVIEAWCAPIEDKTDSKMTVPHLAALMAARRALRVEVFLAEVQQFDGWRLVRREKTWWRLPQEEDLP
jgi:hypothetical protein